MTRMPGPGLKRRAPALLQRRCPERAAVGLLALLLLLPAAAAVAQEAPQRGWVGMAFGGVPDAGKDAVAVQRVVPGSPAARAGLQAGDRVLSVDGREVAGPGYLQAALAAKRPGDTMRLEVRDGKTGGRRTVAVVVAAFDLPALCDQAVRIGAAAIAQRQDASGGWRRKSAAEEMGPDVPMSSFCVRVLLCLPEELRAPYKEHIERGLGLLLAHQIENGAIVGDPNFQHYRTYTSALTLEALTLAGGEGRAEAASRLRAWLVEAQLDDGEEVFEYDFARHGGWNTFDENSPATLRADVSVTTHAIQGLVAAGLDRASPTAQQALVFLGRAQNLPRPNAKVPEGVLDGSFVVNPRESKAGSQSFEDGSVVFRGYGSATADGLRALLRLGVPHDDPRVQLAIRWLSEHFSVTENPGFPPEQAPVSLGIYFYYLHSLVDALALYGQPTLRRADGSEIRWAEAVALRLVTQQLADGTWFGDSSMMNEDDPSLATAFCVGTLARLRPLLTR